MKSVAAAASWARVSIAAEISPSTMPKLRLLGQTMSIQRLKDDIASAAQCDAKVLITGESGAGKEITAHLIHEHSARRSRPYRAINCGAIADSLLESELFGHVRGSFTDAWRDRAGLLDAVHGGTLLLDEVGSMSLRMQGLLLRFLETGELQRVGEDRETIRRDVRVIAATNADVAKAVADGSFRSDLYYRLNVITIVVPPLRERRDDIPLLVEAFIREDSEAHRVSPPIIAASAMARLMDHHWPGNVRELRNVIERIVVRMPGRTIERDDLPAEIGAPAALPAGGVGRTTSYSPDALLERMLRDRVSFWTAVYDPFMDHDLTRADVIAVVRSGMALARGSRPVLLELFNLDLSELHRFEKFLSKYRCLTPQQHSAPRHAIPPSRNRELSGTGFPQAV